MTNLRRLFICILLIGITHNLYGQLSKQQERNLVAFTKLYGYMRFFHPADEAKQIYWQIIAIKGCQKMLEIKDDEELLNGLTNLFQPIGPSIKIYPKTKNIRFNIKDLIPADSQKLKTISWQHSGFNLYGGANQFKSIRLNRKPLIEEGNNISAPLTGNIDVRKFHNKPYEFVVSIGSTNADFHDTVSLSLSDNEASHYSKAFSVFNSQWLSKEPQRYTFKGVVPKGCDFLSFNVVANNVLPISINTIDFRIMQDTSNIVLPLNSNEADVSSNIQTAILNIQLGNSSARPLYEEKMNLGSHINKELVKGISCIIPLALLGDKENTYPIADVNKLNKLKSEIQEDLKYYSNTGGDYVELRLADIIISWNVLKHSFPYWEDAARKPEFLLHRALNDAFLDKSAIDFIKTLKQMCAPLNDGHIFIDFYDGSHNNDSLTLPIYFAKINNRLYVKDVLDSTLFKVISPGDRILKINNDRAIKFFNKTKDLLSGSLQWKESKALTTYLNGTEKEKIQLKFSHQHKSLKRDFSRTFPASSYRAGKESSYQTQTGWIRPGVYYFDLTKLALDSLHISNFLKATAIIFDLRGYPVNDNIFDLIPMLLNSARAIKRIYGLKILLPDFEKMQYKTQFDNYLPSQTHIRAKTFFLTDATAQSASESLLGLVKDFKLGTIIGTPTSGTNGNINILSLPGRYRITFTGMLVKNGDGSKHHLLGIQPDIRASRTLDSYKRKSDNVLKLAIELTKEKK